MAVSTKRSTEAASEPVTGHVTSNDGTRIGYRRSGTGPAVVLVNGATGTTDSFRDLARNLAEEFSVYVPERRGRPLSPHVYHPDHVIARDVEDLGAILDHAGARFVFGLSSGAVIALEAARTLAVPIQRLALYEAPLYVPPRQMRLDLVDRFDREIASGQTAAAMVSALLASGLAPTWFGAVPRPLLEMVLALVLWTDDRRGRRHAPHLRALIPTMQYDFNVVRAMQGRLERFETVGSEVLLLSCKKSAAYMQESSRALQRILPHARRVEFDDLNHGSPWNRIGGGRPDVVAAALREFFRAQA